MSNEVEGIKFNSPNVLGFSPHESGNELIETWTNAALLHTHLHTRKHLCAQCLNVCSCGRGWLILSNSTATLHLPSGTLAFNYHQFIPLAPLLHIATSTRQTNGASYYSISNSDACDFFRIKYD